MGETAKSYPRRIREGWFDKYAPDNKSGLDIGCNKDPINSTFRRWDLIFGDGDATFLDGIPDEKFCTVYSSHVLEHLDFPIFGIQNWYRVLKPGGHLIILVPHRDLYECRKELPSRWNGSHRTFWLPDRQEAPCTMSLRDTVLQAISGVNIVSFRVLDEDYFREGDNHPAGEYSIECIIKKDDNITL
jgi:SAM-dependent methyltransferase